MIRRAIVVLLLGVCLGACNGSEPEPLTEPESAESVTPAAVETELRRATRLSQQGRFDEALEGLEIAHAALPDTRTATLLAELYRVTGSYSDSQRIVDAALEAEPNSTALLLAQARLQARDRRDADAEETLRKLLTLEPRNHLAQRMLGGLLLRAGAAGEGNFLLVSADRNRDYDEAYRPLMAAVDATRDPRSALMLAELDLTVGDYTKAQRWLALSRSGGAPSERLAAAQAWVWYALGEIEKGDAELAKAGASNGYVELARAARAVRTGRSDEARRWITDAVARGPNERSFLRRAADLYMATGAQDEADRLLLRAATAGFP